MAPSEQAGADLKVGQQDFTFSSPVAGTLEYVLFYLYERASQTPRGIWTPTGIHREATRP